VTATTADIEAPTPLDLSAGRSFANGFPHEYFTWLRANRPVFFHEPTEATPGGVGFWVVSRYDDVVGMFKDATTFSSGIAGTQIFDGGGAGVQLNQTDDPQHRRLRALVNKGFTPRMIGRLEDGLRERAQQILDAVPVGEPFDFVYGIARELPLQAICAVLGVPQADRAELADIVDLAVSNETGEVMSVDHLRRLSAYGNELIQRKQAEPADDILSVIVHARLDDDTPQLDDRELRGFFNLLFPAGAETTRSAISGGLQALTERPDQLAALRAADDALMRSAIEEIVRWTSPSVYKRRTTSRDIVLRGVELPAGSKVTLWEASANRDSDVFADPFRFDIARSPNLHVGFGLGTHFCLGASLARLEIKVMMEELLARFGHIELAGEGRWTNNNRLVGLTELPVICRP
jgi:cytochrome P450